MAAKKDKLIDLEQLQIVSKNKQKQIDNLKEKKVNKEEGKSLSSNDFTDSYKAQVEANTTNRHTHSNKSLLDTYTQTNENIADAVSKKHSHENKSVLDGISAEDISNWNGKQNALTTDNTINLVSDVISVNTNVIATKDYAESLFATSEEIDTMLEEVFE